MARTDYYGIQTPVLQATSQAIRTVNGTVGTIAPEDYPDLIAAMKSGTDYDNVMAQLVEETNTPASIASFTDGANNLPVKELICTINPTETGSGAKSPSNPYVIGGHTALNLSHLGKNLIDFSACEFNDSIYGHSVTNADLINQIKEIYPKIAGQTVILSMEKTGTASGSPIGQIRLYSGGTLLQLFTPNTQTTVKTDVDFTTVTLVVIYGSTTGASVSNIMLEVNSAPTTYAPYITPTTHHADFGQTVYGGSLNVTTGVLTITHKNIALFNLSWESYGTSRFMFSLSGSDRAVTENTTSICSCYMPDPNNATGGTMTDSSFSVKGTYCVFKDSNYSSVDDFKNSLSGQYLCYELATPSEVIQLDPIEVRTLLGSNNIYHDCNGNIEVTYRANGALYVAQH